MFGILSEVNVKVEAWLVWYGLSTEMKLF